MRQLDQMEHFIGGLQGLDAAPPKTGPGISLVPFLDAPAWMQDRIRLLRNAPEVRKFMYTDHEISVQEHKNWIERLRGDETQKVFTIVLDGEPAGVVSLAEINARQKRAYFAFYVDDSVRGRGIGSEVERRVLDLAFGLMRLEKVCLEVLSTNAAVVAHHKKFGFIEDGVLRKHVIKYGERADVVTLSILREEWENSPARLGSYLPH